MLNQISLPMGNVMPKSLVKGKDAEAVAAYVADSVGKPVAGGATTTAAAGAGGSPGKALFAEKCGSCHTLTAAGTSGNVGPNLDQTKPDTALVLATIKAGPGVMPPNVVTGKDAQQIADFVFSSAGK